MSMTPDGTPVQNPDLNPGGQAPVNPQYSATPVNPTPVVADPASSGLTPGQTPTEAQAAAEAAAAKLKEAEAAAAAAAAQASTSVASVSPDTFTTEGVVQPQHTDSRINAIESLMAEKGITNAQANAIFGLAISTQDSKNVNVQLLTEVMGKAAADLILTNLQSYTDEVIRQEQESIQYAHKVHGGKERFDAACAWMNSKISDPQLGPELNAIKQMAAAGGASTRLALEMLNTKFTQSGQAAPDLMRPDGGAGSPDLVPFKSNREYSEALKEAYYKGTKADVQAVNARFSVSTGLHRS